ncbi:MAG: hypothetical protein L3J74_02905 [Bacteroidales bacterium]|nr:hypothetical protein [Bacteroidales bacterium]
MLTKLQVKEYIEYLPEEFSIDELIEHLLLIDKIQKGNLQSENNMVVSNEQMEKEIKKWFK